MSPAVFDSLDVRMNAGGTVFSVPDKSVQLHDCQNLYYSSKPHSAPFLLNEVTTVTQGLSVILV